MRKKLEMVLMPCFRGRMANPAFRTSDVDDRLPHTPTSTSPLRTIMAEAASGQDMDLSASSVETGFPFSCRSAE